MEFKLKKKLKKPYTEGLAYILDKKNHTYEVFQFEPLREYSMELDGVEYKLELENMYKIKGWDTFMDSVPLSYYFIKRLFQTKRIGAIFFEKGCGEALTYEKVYAEASYKEMNPHDLKIVALQDKWNDFIKSLLKGNKLGSKRTLIFIVILIVVLVVGYVVLTQTGYLNPPAQTIP